jgi:hypothetical protein
VLLWASITFLHQECHNYANNIHEKLKLDAQCVNGEDKVHGGLVAICNQLTTNIGAK